MKMSLSWWGTLVLGLWLFLTHFARAQEGGAETRSAFVISMKDFGSEDIAYLTVPQTAPRLGILVVPGPTGLSRKVKNQCDLLAANGFIVLAVDLYNGQVPTSQEEALRLQRDLRPEAAFKVIESGRRFFRESPRFFTPNYLLLGFTYNGALTVDAALRMRDAVGMVLIEPNPVDPKALERLRIPTLIVASMEDGAWNTLLADAIRSGMSRRVSIEPLRKEAPIGFMMSEFAERDHFDVWTRIIQFAHARSKEQPRSQGNWFQRLLD